MTPNRSRPTNPRNQGKNQQKWVMMDRHQSSLKTKANTHKMGHHGSEPTKHENQGKYPHKWALTSRDQLRLKTKANTYRIGPRCARTNWARKPRQILTEMGFDKPGPTYPENQVKNILKLALMGHDQPSLKIKENTY